MKPTRPRHATLPRLLLALASLTLATPALAKPQFIVESRILYPVAVGELTFEAVHWATPRHHEGIGLRYKLASQPDLGVNVFVMPVGRMPEADAVERARSNMRAGYLALKESDKIQDLVEAKERKLDLQLDEYVTLHGYVMSFTFLERGKPSAARVMLLYRHDYYYAVCLQGDASDQAKLDQALVRLAADLVPQVRVRSGGDCMTPRRPGESLLDRPEDDVDGGCVASLRHAAAQPYADDYYVDVEFPADSWEGTRLRAQLPTSPARAAEGSRPKTKIESPTTARGARNNHPSVDGGER